MTLHCIQEFQEVNEQIRKLHEDTLNKAKQEGIIWKESECKNCKNYVNFGVRHCKVTRCVHNEESWSGCRIPYIDYCSFSEVVEKSSEPDQIVNSREPNKITELIKVETRVPGIESHLEAVQVVSETENYYTLKNGDFVYKKNGERRSPSGKNKIYGRITVRYYPPTVLDELEDCPNCKKSIFFPFNIIKKPSSSNFKPIAKVCPHCGFEIKISEV